MPPLTSVEGCSLGLLTSTYIMGLKGVGGWFLVFFFFFVPGGPEVFFPVLQKVLKSYQIHIFSRLST